jgi:hypothetical protein
MRKAKASSKVKHSALIHRLIEKRIASARRQMR